MTNFSGATLTGADLRDRDLTGADFTGAQCQGCFFRDAILVGADFTGANLESADLTRADLRGAIMTGANMEDAIFDDAIFGPSPTDEDGIEAAKLRLDGAVLVARAMAERDEPSVQHLGSFTSRSSMAMRIASMPNGRVPDGHVWLARHTDGSCLHALGGDQEWTAGPWVREFTFDDTIEMAVYMINDGPVPTGQEWIARVGHLSYRATGGWARWVPMVGDPKPQASDGPVGPKAPAPADADLPWSGRRKRKTRTRRGDEDSSG